LTSCRSGSKVSTWRW